EGAVNRREATARARRGPPNVLLPPRQKRSHATVLGRCVVACEALGISPIDGAAISFGRAIEGACNAASIGRPRGFTDRGSKTARATAALPRNQIVVIKRSEEHTSELQSRS